MTAALRVFDPTKPTGHAPEAWTLRDAWMTRERAESWELGLAESTLRKYRLAVRRFEEWAAKESPTQPLLEQITADTLTRWRAWLLMTLPGDNRELNANGHVQRLEGILRWAAQGGRIDSAPHIRQLPARSAAGRLYLQYDELSRIYDACVVARWPVLKRDGGPLPYHPATYWRAALVLFFNYGFRTSELVAYRSTHCPLGWDQVTEAEETPGQDGRARSRHGWLWYLPAKQKRKKGEPLVLPLNRITAAHLRSIYPGGPGDLPPPELDPVFPWPRSSDKLYATWARILEAAKVAPKPDLTTGAARTFTIAHLRKTATTWHNLHRPGIAPLITGHAARELTGTVRADASLPAGAELSAVSAEHYDNRELAVVEALETFPQPPAFRSIFDGPRYYQKELF
jgi:hypothetical protein